MRVHSSSPVPVLLGFALWVLSLLAPGCSTAYAATTPTSWAEIGQSTFFDANRCLSQWYSAPEANCSVTSSTSSKCQLHGILEGSNLEMWGWIDNGGTYHGDMGVRINGVMSHQATVEFKTGVARTAVYYRYDNGLRAQCEFAYARDRFGNQTSRLIAYFTGFW